MRLSTMVRALLVGAAVVAVGAGPPVLAATAADGSRVVADLEPTLTATSTTEPSSTVLPTEPASTPPMTPPGTGPATSAPATSGPTTSGPSSTAPNPPPNAGLPTPVPPVEATNPAVTLDPAVTRTCRDGAGTRLTTKLRLAQNAYDAADRIYQAAMRLVVIGTKPPEYVAPLQLDLIQATIALNNVRYELARCQTQAGADPRKECTLVSLDLNRVSELLVQRQLMVDAAKRWYDVMALKVAIGTIPAQDAVPAKKAWEDAKAMLDDALQDQQDVRAAVNRVAQQCGFMPYPEPPTP
ncbi:MAG TPA: hypothetical protein VMU51_19425 [Mycobacteriales bacterium]|nr:hypothetical protein [Mycobacteriales bacterium]